jgi:hypothetical protein
MSVRHQVRLYDTSGVQLAIFDTWRSLTVNKKVNAFGDHTFKLDKRLDNRWQLFGLDCFVEVMRQDQANGIGWTQEYLGFHRTPQHSLTETGNRIFTSYGRSLEDILNRHSVAYQSFAATNAPYFYANKTGPADNVMKAFVRDNFGPGANNSSRLRDGSRIAITVPDDTSQAPTWQGERAYRKVYDVITEISQAAAVDFSIEMLSMSPPTFIFHTFYPLRGTDRSLLNPPTILSDERQNVKSIDYTTSRTDEANIAIIVGSVQNYIPDPNPNQPGKVVGHRVVFTGTSHGVFDSPWNDIEIVRDARNDETTQALSNIADQAYATLGAHESFVVTPLNYSNAQYGKHFFLGDKLIVSMDGTQRIKRVVGVSINSGGDSDSGGNMGETLSIELGDVVATFTGNPIMDAFRNISTRIDTLEHQGNL